MLIGKKSVIIIVTGLVFLSSVAVSSYFIFSKKEEKVIDEEIIEPIDIESKTIEIEVKEKSTDVQSINDIVKSDDVKKNEEQILEKKDNVKEKKSNNVNNNTKQENKNPEVSVSNEQNIVIKEEKNQNQQKQENSAKNEQDKSKPDPNNPFFSFHKGKVEYKERQSCLNDYSKIAFIDTEDILNGTCMEVTDYNGNVLGYYLHIKCLSGNCNKYDKYKTFS